MNTLTKTCTLIIAVFMTVGNPIYSQEPKERNIVSLVDLYEKALNENSAERIHQLFTIDGVVVLQGAPTAQGTEGIKQMYSSLFEALDFDLTFKIEEIVYMSEGWAFIRTSSTGGIQILSNDTSFTAKGHELFILKKQANGYWEMPDTPELLPNNSSNLEEDIM